MLPAFIIGLREGLETVVIIGAIVLFLRVQGRGDLLRRLWQACALAAAICVGLAFVIRFVEVNLPWRQQEQFETVIGLAAVCTVTYMVVWMRRFPKDLRHDSSAAAASAFARDSGRALIVLAFFAVLREGFEIAVFVVATVGLTGSSAWLATGGAFLGVAVALAAGVGIVRGSGHVNVARFFRATALVLVLSAAGIAMSTVHTANAAGWITFGQTPQFDLSWLAPPGSVLSSFTTGMFGLQPYPVIVEVVTWFAYFVPMTAVVLWPRRKVIMLAPQTLASTVVEPDKAREVPRRRRPVWILCSLAGCSALVALVVGLVGSGGTTSSTANRAAVKPRILYATLDDVSCPSETHCVAVGEFLPVDKDAAIHDPDGDGRASHTLAELSDGTRWHLLPSPNEGRGGAVLSGVSCPSATDCVAVGYYRRAKFPLQASNAPPNYPLVESYNGRTWHIVPNPPVAPNSILVSVACPRVSDCVAVGSTTTSPSGGKPVELFFIEDFDGKSWTVMSTSAPRDTSSGLSSVSCPGPSICVAVGNVAPKSNPSATHPLIEVLDAGHWSRASLPPTGNGPGILYDVACTSVQHCVAVGSTEALRPSGSALALSSVGSSWTVNTGALSQKGSVSLTTVSCASKTDCVVAGTSWRSLEAGPEKILGRVDGDEWHELGISSKSANIEDIACTQAARCLLVGSIPQNSFGNTTTLVASLSGRSLATQPSPVP